MSFIEKMAASVKAEKNIPVVTSNGGSDYSFGVVNSGYNGKRLTFSKALAKKLQLEDNVCLFPMKDDGTLMVAKEFPGIPADYISSGILKGEERKTCYSAGLVQMIVECFGLDYSGGRTSMSFSTISFDTCDGVVIAQINMAKGTAPASDHTVISDDTE